MGDIIDLLLGNPFLILIILGGLYSMFKGGNKLKQRMKMKSLLQFLKSRMIRSAEKKLEKSRLKSKRNSILEWKQKSHIQMTSSHSKISVNSKCCVYLEN